MQIPSSLWNLAKILSMRQQRGQLRKLAAQLAERLALRIHPDVKGVKFRPHAVRVVLNSVPAIQLRWLSSTILAPYTPSSSNSTNGRGAHRPR